MQTNRRNQALALTAVAAFAAYVLACRPSFSPDGSQILFPALHTETSELTVLRYDRKTEKTDPIFVLGKGAAADKPVLISTVWSPDGKQAVVVWAAEENKINLAVLPLESRQPTRFLAVPLQDKEEAMGGLIFPPLLSGRYLFLGGKVVSRVDLENGEIETVTVRKTKTGETDQEQDEDEAVYLVGQGEELYYVAGNEEALEIGTIHPDTLEVKTRLSLEGKDEKLVPLAAFSKDGTRIAIVGEESEGSKISIIRGSRLERTLRVGTEEDPVRLGTILWSRDEKHLYVAALKEPLADGQRHRLLVLEISVEEPGSRSIPLGPFEDEGDGALTSAQIALSPDGKTVAISTTCCLSDNVKPEDQALYLIDLSAPERKVTRVRPPWAR